MDLSEIIVWYMFRWWKWQMTNMILKELSHKAQLFKNWKLKTLSECNVQNPWSLFSLINVCSVEVVRPTWGLLLTHDFQKRPPQALFTVPSASVGPRETSIAIRTAAKAAAGLECVTLDEPEKASISTVHVRAKNYCPDSNKYNFVRRYV